MGETKYSVFGRMPIHSPNGPNMWDASTLLAKGVRFETAEKVVIAAIQNGAIAVSIEEAVGH